MDGSLRQQCLALCLGALCALPWTTGANAENVALTVLERLGQGVEVRQYPVTSGTLDTFNRRRQDAAADAIDEVQKTFGVPLLKEVQSETDVRLVYASKLVVVTGRYSNGIICRIDVPVAGLREGFSEEAITELAARSCRVAEEQSWGASGFDAVTPIGAEQLPEVSDAQVRIYATEYPFTLFPELVREVEVRSGGRASLVRKENRSGESPQVGAFQWRYAWFENGNLLAVRYQAGAGRAYGSRNVDLVCAIIVPGDSLPSLEQGPFANWCDNHIKRLSPALDIFVEAVERFRRADTDGRPAQGVPSMSGGFHDGLLPIDLTAEFWKTGQVPVFTP
jgi:hypothetical protein